MNFKKLMTAFCIAAIFSTAFSFTACNQKDKEESNTVMNLSLNPQVEFILDSNDKVVSVNALNEEGNLIITAEAFQDIEGKSADEAAKLFAQISKDTGFLIEGSISDGENQIDISLSGDAKDTEALYSSVKDEINAYLSDENITATITQTEAITKAELEKLVAECSPYLKEAEIKAMEYQDLVKTLLESRKETAKLYSQQLKDAYYEAKAFALEQAQLEVLKSKLPLLQQAAVEALSSVYVGLVNNIEQLRYDHLIKEDSLYQTALKDFREAKTEYLNYKNYVAETEDSQVTADMTEHLAALDQAVENMEAALLSAGENANTLLDTAKANVKTAYDEAIAAIENASIQASAYLSEISTAQQTAITNFTKEFENTYTNEKAAAQTAWENMYANLNAGYQAE